MLWRVRSVGPNDKLQVGNLAQGFDVYRRAAKRSIEDIDRWGNNAADGDIMDRSDQHDACDRMRAISKRCECRGSNAARIGIACVRCDQRFGCDVLRRRHIGEQLQNLCPEQIRITGIELAGNRWRPARHAL